MDDLYWRIPVIVLLIIMSATFSGLTLGLLGLDTAHLQVLIEQDQEDEESTKQAENASKIYPIRKKGNLLLSTLLIGNVAVNAGLSILLADLTDGLLGFLLSTVLIVIFGEIAPQAVLSRYGLQIGAKLVWVMKVIIILLYVLAKPISVILDYCLGDDPGTKFTKTQMKAMFLIYEREHLLDRGQYKILSSVLDFNDAKVSQIVTPLADTFMLDANEDLTVEIVKEIYENGYSRVPVYDGSRENIIGILMAKDLMFINFSQLSKLWKMRSLFLRLPLKVKGDEHVQDVLKKFKDRRSHLAVVEVVVNDGIHDPRIGVAGIITLEDIIECLLQEAITDERDRSKLKERKTERNISLLLFSNYYAKDILSECELVAVKDYLQRNCEPFKRNFINSGALFELICCSRVIVLSGNEQNMQEDDEVDDNRFDDSRSEAESERDPEDLLTMKMLYRRGNPCPYFFMVLSGHVDVRLGSEEILSEQGPFKCLGVNALLNPSSNYIPDFSAQVSQKARLLRISQNLYMKFANS